MAGTLESIYAYLEGSLLDGYGVILCLNTAWVYQALLGR